ncbi:MAG: hypothetical protein K9K86_08540 [Pseudomonadales bacterium]|nr:hypothetical protein [Pseudomonadales bacterium]
MNLSTYMIKTTFYIAGALALHHTDFSHPNTFYHLFLPIVDLIFLIFLSWQMLFFFTLNNFSDGKNYGFHDLIVDIYDLRYDIQDHGLASALFTLSLNLIDFICIFLSVFYYYSLIIELVTN